VTERGHSSHARRRHNRLTQCREEKSHTTDLKHSLRVCSKLELETESPEPIRPAYPANLAW